MLSLRKARVFPAQVVIEKYQVERLGKNVESLAGGLRLTAEYARKLLAKPAETVFGVIQHKHSPVRGYVEGHHG